MPVYVYQCSNCDYQFEQQQKFSDNPLKKCPKCGETALHKVYTPVGVIYKGSGFYSTDHRSSSGANISSAKTSDNDKKPDAEKKPESKKNEVKEKD